MSESDENSVDSLTFETAMAELERIVDRLERGEVALEDSIAIYERGEALKGRCEALLKAAEERVEKSACPQPASRQAQSRLIPNP